MSSSTVTLEIRIKSASKTKTIRVADHLKGAVKKILRGYQREETDRLIAFRSHWGLQTEFCNPARGNEKGGVEGRLLPAEPPGAGAKSERHR
jgi:hypothetical protein